MADLVGIDGAGVTEWFAEHVPSAAAPLEFELVAGGRSNLTFAVTDSNGTRWALRRPPTSHVLPTAHDMSREHRIIAALSPTPVPVPEPIGLCTDPDVNGAPFYVMDFVEGTVVRDTPTAEKVLDVAARRRCGESIIDTLADIHDVDVDAVGLGDLARREGYIERQLKRWYGQFQQSTDETGRKVAAVDEMHDFLKTRIPDQGPATIVHGDYRLDNCMIASDGSVAAVLDWEICTLGDPLADVGLLMVYWADAGDTYSALGSAPTTLEGFGDRAELRARYAARSGRDVSELDFFIAFGYWKLACILEGVYTRYAAGAGGGDNSDFEGFAQQVALLAEASRTAAATL